ncbi:MAG: hypothetical protein PHY31_10235, partial [Smithellaceae bacterium]|nr:hypothetical protein [Smithellaceae bacterium]
LRLKEGGKSMTMIWHLTTDGATCLCGVYGGDRMNVHYADRELSEGQWCDRCQAIHKDPEREAIRARREKAYLAKHGEYCPYCESDQIGGGPVEIDAGYAHQDIFCLSCEKGWMNEYTLTGLVED